MSDTTPYLCMSLHLNKTTHKHVDIFMIKCQYDSTVVVQKVLADLFHFTYSFSKKESTEW